MRREVLLQYLLEGEGSFRRRRAVRSSSAFGLVLTG
jgi:hypothetical protein